MIWLMRAEVEQKHLVTTEHFLKMEVVFQAKATTQGAQRWKCPQTLLTTEKQWFSKGCLVMYGRFDIVPYFYTPRRYHSLTLLIKAPWSCYCFTLKATISLAGGGPTGSVRFVLTDVERKQMPSKLTTEQMKKQPCKVIVVACWWRHWRSTNYIIIYPSIHAFPNSLIMSRVSWSWSTHWARVQT